MKIDKIICKLLKEQREEIAKYLRENVSESSAKAIEDMDESNDWEVLKKYV